MLLLLGVQCYRGRLDPTLPAKVLSSFHLPVKEDRSLDGLAYHEVRDIFVRWIATGEAKGERWIDSSVYDWYFIYVDRDTLEKF